MSENDLPEWATEMDEEILERLNIGWTLTPTVIADNIGRSREGVSRRLNTLEAGGLVEKVDRGKYRITEKAEGMMDKTWEKIELSEEARRKVALEDYEQDQWIEKELGVERNKFLTAVSKEFDKLRDSNPESSDDLLSEAFENVEERIREGEELN